MMGDVFNHFGNFDEAIRHYRQAAKLAPENTEAHLKWGITLTEKKDWKNAIERLSIAKKLNHKNADIHNYWGLSLELKGDLNGAIEQYTLAIGLDPKSALAYCNLGNAYKSIGKFKETVAALQKGHELGARLPDWNYQSNVWLREAQYLLLHEKKLASSPIGYLPNLGECLGFYLVSAFKKNYVAAAGYFGNALALLPPKSTSLKTGKRIEAALYAVRAARGQGRGVRQLTVKEKGNFLGDALSWMKTDLAQWRKTIVDNEPHAILAAGILQHWLTDPKFAIIRDEVTLSKLPTEYQSKYRTFWSDVTALQEQAASQTKKTLWKGILADKTKENSHIVQMTSGRNYRIELISKQFDTTVRIVAPEGQELAKNDDDGDYLNSRLSFTPKQCGSYHIVATSHGGHGRGAYVLTALEWVPKN